MSDQPKAYNVFIVEDHPTMQAVYTHYFKRSNGLHLVGIASSGEEVLENLDAGIWDCSAWDLVLFSLGSGPVQPGIWSC